MCLRGFSTSLGIESELGGGRDATIRFTMLEALRRNHLSSPTVGGLNLPPPRVVCFLPSDDQGFQRCCPKRVRFGFGERDCFLLDAPLGTPPVLRASHFSTFEEQSVGCHR